MSFFGFPDMVLKGGSFDPYDPPLDPPLFTIVAPINYFMPFYSSRASDSDGIRTNHLTQNGCREEVLHSLDTTATQHTRFIAPC